MSERLLPQKEIQKEFGEVERIGPLILIKRFGTKEEVGRASLVENDKPIPHLTLLNVDVPESERGKGFASQILAEVERISEEAHRPVILYDVTERYHREQNPKAIHMYGKRTGWVPVLDAHGVPIDRYMYGISDPAILAKFYEHYK